MRVSLQALSFVTLSLVGVVPLMSLTELLGWLQWTGWIGDVVDWYRQLLHPVYDHAAQLVDMQVPGWGKDYVNSSATFYAAYSKAVKRQYGAHWIVLWRERLGDEAWHWAQVILLLPLVFVFFLLLPPVLYLGTIIIGPGDDEAPEFIDLRPDPLAAICGGDWRITMRLYLIGYLVLELGELSVASLFA